LQNRSRHRKRAGAQAESEAKIRGEPDTQLRRVHGSARIVYGLRDPPQFSCQVETVEQKPLESALE
jgi:hypothetical protein